MTLSRATTAGWMVQVVAIVIAFTLARRRTAHRPFAIWAAVVLAADILCTLSNAGPLNAPRPYTGGLRALFHVQQALWLAEPIGLPMLAWLAFLNKRPWPPLLAGAAIVLALAVGYPWPFRGAVLGYALASIQALSIAACLIAMAIWSRCRAHPRIEHACVSLATLLTCALFSGPYAPPCPAPFDDWSFAELVYLCIWSALALIQIASLWGGFAMQQSGRETSARLH